MRSPWSEMWPLAYLIGPVEQHPTSPSRSVLGTVQQNLTVRQYQVILSRRSLVHLYQSEALLMTLGGVLGATGGPEGSYTDVNTVWHCLVICGRALKKKHTIRSTSDTVAWNETPLGAGADTDRRFLVTFTYMLLSALHTDGQRTSLRLVTFCWVIGFIRKLMVPLLRDKGR